MAPVATGGGLREGSGDLEAFGFEIAELPDFLKDHTLLAESPWERLVEHSRRWASFVAALWRWRDRAIFCLRFSYDPIPDRTSVFFLARAITDGVYRVLSQDLRVSLEAFGLECRPELYTISNDPLHIWRLSAKAEIREVLQGVDRTLWSDQTEIDRLFPDPWSGPAGAAPRQPPVVLPWRGPGGPFLLPFHALRSNGLPASISVLLQPTQLLKAERAWIAQLAGRAETTSQQTLKSQVSQIADFQLKNPTANLASKLYLAHFRRLIQPFMVVVQCVSDGEDGVAVRALAAAVQATCQEPPFAAADEDKSLPCGADLVAPAVAQQVFNLAAAPVMARENFSRLTFHRWAEDPLDIGPTRRLRYITDAVGAATVFRLPVNVRGGVPGVRVVQREPDFNPGPDRERPSGEARTTIHLGDLRSGGTARVDANDFTKHVLVTGFTGSGKTRTVLHLLHQLRFPAAPRGSGEAACPFLVIESAKQEYRGLLNCNGFDSREKLLIFTLGNEDCVPFRLNPFELLSGMRLETHLARILECLAGAMPPLPFLPSIIEESLISIYVRHGWDMSSVGPPANNRDALTWPTMTDLYRKACGIAARRYAGEVRSNVTGALRTRLKPLTGLIRGSRGRMFDTQISSPSAEMLFQTPTILEMNDLGAEDKSLATLLLLNLVREFREVDAARNPISGRLRHVTVVEEAHNVLENVATKGGGEGASSDVKFRTVQAFCNLLSEVRALGEGIIIADQSPEKLAPDAMRNTNVQIAHQLRDAKDREAVGRAMIMTPEQAEFLGKLLPGEAAVFYTGLQQATFVSVPEFGSGKLGALGGKYHPMVSNARVESHMGDFTAAYKRPDRPFRGCDACGVRAECTYRARARAGVTRGFMQAFDGAFDLLKNAVETKSSDAQEVYILQMCENAFAATGYSPAAELKFDFTWCALLHLWHQRRRPRTIPGPDLDPEHWRSLVAKTLLSAHEKWLLTCRGRAGAVLERMP